MPSPSEKESLVRKYDAIASAYATHYRDPAAVARRHVALLARWGRRLDPGATVLELGCADGLVTEALAQAGFRVTAVDLSPAMIEAARRRLDRAGLGAKLLVADIDEFETSATFDAVLAMMRNFFHYSSDPSSTV
ncbi:MAG: class I SAM-dependent methyltransferase [Armatimonadota bacterium]|nr:class I SAM-dependent methyltransferase [Armatimonadota bacterium]